jgi:hypothetical protein
MCFGYARIGHYKCIVLRRAGTTGRRSTAGRRRRRPARSRPRRVDGMGVSRYHRRHGHVIAVRKSRNCCKDADFLITIPLGRVAGAARLRPEPPVEQERLWTTCESHGGGSCGAASLIVPTTTTSGPGPTLTFGIAKSAAGSGRSHCPGGRDWRSPRARLRYSDSPPTCTADGIGWVGKDAQLRPLLVTTRPRMGHFRVANAALTPRPMNDVPVNQR